MFFILIRRELLANLMTFRFSVARIVTLLLVVANTVVLIADYERRLIGYNTAAKQHHKVGISTFGGEGVILHTNLKGFPNAIRIM